jgi:DNA-binding transcriptional MerR regulator
MREMHDTPTTELLLLAGEGHEHRSAPAASEPMYTIGHVAKQFGLTLRTLRFYDNVGLLKPVRCGAKRLYGPKDIERLALIIKAKKLGFPLTAIPELIVEEGGRQTLRLTNEACTAQIALLERKLADIEAALAELRGTLAQAGPCPKS